jgi:hypothetical protein
MVLLFLLALVSLLESLFPLALLFLWLQMQELVYPLQLEVH